jgi:hypothetical protein
MEIYSRERFIQVSKTYFISGHRDATIEEFKYNYIPKILRAISEGASFVVGDCQGIDNMAIGFLKNLEYMLLGNVTVYHMFEEPRFNAGFETKGGFRSDVERDFAMTLASDEDIAWTRKGRERSGTGCNLDRRILKNEGKLSWDNIDRTEANRFI